MDRRVELTGLRSDGSEFPVELTVTRVPLDGPPLFTAYLRDITDRKRTEAELRASRTRVVESADRERRRIERNLHDGAQQRLVSINLLLHQVARAELDGASRELVSLVQEEAGRAIEELRELARGIHPASLTDGGLRNALVGLGRRSALEVTVDAPDGRLPASVEVALYYVAAESLANVAKYAGIDRASVTVTVTETEATLTVVDEGAGGADPGDGTGLAGLVDRIEAIGGRLEVHSPAGGGTTVVAVAPLP
jgi:signal transduction histidine kinase